MSQAVLEVRDIRLSFGSVTALDGVSLKLGPEEIVGLIGPNGAGKSSLLNCISGFYRPQRGEVVFEGRAITNLPAHERARIGIARTFQGIQVYSGMTVLENILAGCHVRLKTGMLSAFLYWPWAHREEMEARAVAETLLDFLDLEPYRHRLVGELGYGLRKRVDLGRALAMGPRALLMDEPMAGMNVEEKEDMARFILDVREARRIPILLVEHDMAVVMDLCDRIVVLDWGRVIAEGPPERIRRDPAVIKAYLGEG